MVLLGSEHHTDRSQLSPRLPARPRPTLQPTRNRGGRISTCLCAPHLEIRDLWRRAGRSKEHSSAWRFRVGERFSLKV